MSRLVFFILLGLAGWYGWRYLRTQQSRIDRAVRKAEAEVPQRKTVQLEKDPETGVYRPRDRD